MKIKITPTFKFKGSRTYVHGTDLFNSGIESIKALNLTSIKNINATFHSIIKTQTEGYITDEDVKDTKASFQLSFQSSDKDYKLVLFEKEQVVEDRYAYPEEEIVNLCSIQESEKKIELTDSIKFSNVEKLVAMNKGLLEKLFPGLSGKWYFTRLQLINNFEKVSYDKYTVKLIKNLNFRLTKSEVFLEDKLIGYIYFSLV